MTSRLALQWLPCQAPGAIGSVLGLVVIRSVLGLVGPVSVYCGCVRRKVWSAASVSVWQRVKLSEQIRPLDTLACCWDVKQPTKKKQKQQKNKNPKQTKHTKKKKQKKKKSTPRRKDRAMTQSETMTRSRLAGHGDLFCQLASVRTVCVYS